MIIDFKIESKDKISSQFLEKGIGSFAEACNYIARLPYYRTSNGSDACLVMSEGHGTCSSKHMLLIWLAKENKADEIRLMVGIYKMSPENTPVLLELFKNFGIEYLPEAHCYLKYQGERFDFTRANSVSLSDDQILYEQRVSVDQMPEIKKEIHQNFLRKWMVEKGIDRSFEEVWGFRERCIEKLTHS